MRTFDLTRALPERTTSANTQRAYYRWIDRYLVDQIGIKPTQGDARLQRMQRLAVKSMRRYITPRRLRTWLETLAQEGCSRQSLDQARASVVTLADLLAEANCMDPRQAADVRAVSVPPVAHKTTPERLLTRDELRRVMDAARAMATSPNQMLRNSVVSTILCTMALRREELSSAKWSDVHVADGRVYLKLHNNGTVEIPRNVLVLIDRWRSAVASDGFAPPPHSPLVRRIWKGGRIARDGLSPDGIWLIIRDASQYAGMEPVAPDDLRRSAVAGLRDAGVPVEEISRLLRHRSTLITERFLSRLPRPEDGKSGM